MAVAAALTQSNGGPGTAGVLPIAALPDLAEALHSFPSLSEEELEELGAHLGHGGLVTFKRLLAWWHRSRTALERVHVGAGPPTALPA